MNIEYLRILGTWRDVVDAARTTINRQKGTQEPTPSWKRSILLSEHSPIRQILVKWKWVELPYWVSVHFVRHKIGIEHFVSTQRTDRTGQNRDTKSQSALVSHECIANAQAMINISRKRLCTNASQETIRAWKAVLEKLQAADPDLYSVLVPECIYRGFCPELKSCGYGATDPFIERLKEYRSVTNEDV